MTWISCLNVDNMKVVVSTSKLTNANKKMEARACAQFLGVNYIERLPLKKIFSEYADVVMLFEQYNIKLITNDQVLFFHPSMAKIRIDALKSGNPEHLYMALNIKVGMKILDATLGLGSDSLLMSHAVGDSGHIFALESSPFIAFMVKHGLENYNFDSDSLRLAAQRITVQNIDYNYFLNSQGNNTFDVVYFDPMFPTTLSGSCNIQPLRMLANTKLPSEKVITEALRVARERVVIKQPVYSNYFDFLPISKVFGGKYSRVKYLVLEKTAL